MTEPNEPKPSFKETLKTTLSPEADESMTRVSMLGRLRNYLLAGILVTAPLGITVYLVWIFLQFMDLMVADLVPAEYNPNTYLPFSLPGVGLIVAIVFFILVGWFAKNILGRLIIGLYEGIMERVPIIRHLYGALKQIGETIMASQSQAFREVVLMEYPRRGVWSVGFVTARTEGEVQRAINEDTINVFVPTTPNPTSGYLLFVPKTDLHYLDMSVEEGVKLVVSAGIITPPDRAAKSEEVKKPSK